METKMEARRARAKAEKKAKKEAKRKADAAFKAPAPIANGSGAVSSSNGESAAAKDTAAAKDAETSASGAKISKVSNGHSKTDDKSKIKSSGAKKGVQNDPSKSEVFKSLFSSHKSAQNRPKGNWVTFDPRYN